MLMALVVGLSVVLWRISNHVSLTGDGALRVSGRWHTRGRRIVYCSKSPAAALLEERSVDRSGMQPNRQV